MSYPLSPSALPVLRSERECRNAHSGFVVWFTGLSGAGKSTLARHVERQLHDHGCHTYLLDGDEMRRGLCSDLGFGEADRRENLRRVAQVCRLFVDAGVIVLAAFISPFEKDRAMVRSLVGTDDLVEVYCDAPLDVCERRDVKGLYARARRGDIADFTGISSAYEPPRAADLVVHTGVEEVGYSVDLIMTCLVRQAKVRLPHLIKHTDSAHAGDQADPLAR